MSPLERAIVRLTAASAQWQARDATGKWWSPGMSAAQKQQSKAERNAQRREIHNAQRLKVAADREQLKVEREQLEVLRLLAKSKSV